MATFLNKKYNDPLILSELLNSTTTLEFKLSNLKFMEKDLINQLECYGNVVAIDCNYGHKKLKMYDPPFKEKLSNRGRKKTKKVIKRRNKEGDGSSFGTQISIVIAQEVIRVRPPYRDRYSRTAIKLDNKYESILKEYKIKVFRNGKGSIPGVLNEDYSDVMPAIDKLLIYLNESLKPEKEIKLVYMTPKMKNYKTKLLNNQVIDIRYFYYFCNEQLTDLYNTNFIDIHDFISNPILDGKNPHRNGWSRYIGKDNFHINWDKLFPFLDRGNSPKNIYVDKEILLAKLKEQNFEIEYKKVMDYLYELRKYYVVLDDKIISAIMKVKVAKQIYQIKKEMSKIKDKSISSIRYDKENYPGFIIKVMTPIKDDPEKKSTIKIFPSGKINIDGVRDLPTACQLYYWLNHIFYTNPNLTYLPNQFGYDTDSEFSE